VATTHTEASACILCCRNGGIHVEIEGDRIASVCGTDQHVV